MQPRGLSQLSVFTFVFIQLLQSRLTAFFVMVLRGTRWYARLSLVPVVSQRLVQRLESSGPDETLKSGLVLESSSPDQTGLVLESSEPDQTRLVWC